MPRAAKKKNDIDPAGTYVCWQSGAALVDGEEYTFVAGERLRGDSPLVQATAQSSVLSTATRSRPTGTRSSSATKPTVRPLSTMTRSWSTSPSRSSARTCGC